jgi:hypothetical protein
MKLHQRQTLGALDLYEDVLPAHVPTARHPELWHYDESSCAWAARVGADRMGTW